jgi:hypothetical protein
VEEIASAAGWIEHTGIAELIMKLLDRFARAFLVAILLFPSW